MKSKTDELTEKAFYHAMNFFKSNDRGVDNQRVCVKQLMEITGFDFDTCLKIQNPILDFYMQVDMRNIGQSVIENNLRMVTQSIHNHLLGLQSDHISIEKPIVSDTYIGSDTYKNIIAKTSSPTHGYLLSDIRTIDISKAGLKDHDIGVLVKNLQYQLLNLDKFDVSHNQLGYSSVENLFYTFRLGSPTATYNIKYMNLSNNQIDDDGVKYISSHLSAGLHPNLRCLDVTGNNLSYGMCIEISKIVQSIEQNIKILVNRLFSIDTIIQGGKKQSDLAFGSKEEKQTIIKEYLKHAQKNGVDIQNVAVSKDIFDKIINNYNLGKNFVIGFTKCKIVPKNFTAFVEDKIIARVSPFVSEIKTITDNASCYFETFDKSISSQEGIQFMLDTGIVTTTELLGNVE
ncbi:Leucine Rich repeats domain-containing protein (plasmid) [Candidatus Trichorickettsia mobilis]|uniref:Leucine Rich repeats domain-containing protein n=1 Tax=Candidatus Trichorickettsia mobilis TaxID=1346319 RepID=A0ABZ0UWJ8_9RICK|nr:hypothetical protein [Candidatus Trichorickettsia mobilis]WPY01555.1 Leucine Rich repeats domain-containing protein [Candidatus Trichorickettsia mobilis]